MTASLKVRIVRDLLVGSLVIFALGGASYCLYIVATAQALTSRDTLLLSVLLTLLSVFASWTVSRHYAIFSSRENATEMIDTVASQSSEKILNLSNQLLLLKDFLEGILEVADSEYNIHAANSAFRHRVTAAAHMIELLRSSNDTFTSDWIGVCSEQTKIEIEDLKRLQRQMIQDYAIVKGAHAETTADESTDAGSEHLREALQRIEETQSKLPVAVAPELPKVPAVSAHQEWDVATTEKQQGRLILSILRPVFNATGSGKLYPNMSTVPTIFAKLLEAPPGTSMKLAVHGGTGTAFDFHVHLKSNEYGTRLIPGRYLVEYIAQVAHGEEGPTSNDGNIP
jgi:hypothetical protein